LRLLGHSQAVAGLVFFDAIIELALLYCSASRLLRKYVGKPSTPKSASTRETKAGYHGYTLANAVTSAVSAATSVENSQHYTADAFDPEAASEYVLQAAVGSAAMDAAKNGAIIKLKPKLEPILVKHGLDWGSLQQLIHEVSLEQLEAAADDLESNCLRNTSHLQTSLSALARPA